MATVPTRKAQIERVAEFIDSPDNEERSLAEVAKIIVDGMYDMWMRGVEDPPIPLKVGMAFKTPFVASKVYHVAWIGPEYIGDNPRTMVWVIDAASDYGTLTEYGDPLWRIVIPSNAKAGGPGTNKDGWKEGDHLSLIQRIAQFNIIAVGDKTVLMRDRKTGWLQADKNANLEKYYNKENDG